MNAIVADASVVAKWFLPEIHSDAALHWMSSATLVMVPEIVFAELGNVLWKRVRKKEITEDQADTIVQTFSALSLECHPIAGLIGPALQIACATERSVYDSLYLALAVQEDAQLITADARFHNALIKTPFASYSRWVEDI